MAQHTALPFFPTPYPGESLYSVFCRYHQRSANPTHRDTIIQLFGSYRSLSSSILSPFRLNYSPRWYDPETGISGMKLMLENTAYQYYSLSLWPWKKDAYMKAVSGCEEPQLSIVSMSHEVSCKTHLCYCPECAEEDRRLYGETYWHILPQLNGVEYCPYHACRIRKSSISKLDAMWHLVPANTVLCMESHGPIVPHDFQTMQNYLDLARDSEWMLHNGRLLDYNKVNAQIVKDVSKQTHNEGRRNATLCSGFILTYLQERISMSMAGVFLNEMLSVYNLNNLEDHYWKFLLGCYAVKFIVIHSLYGSVEKMHELLLNKNDSTI